MKNKLNKEHLENIKPFIHSSEINAKIKQLAKRIDSDYNGAEITLLVILKGGVFFGIDLMRELKCNVRLETITASSYRNEQTSGDLIIKGESDLDVAGQHVLIVDDIYDTGNTLKAITRIIEQKNPKTVKTATLISKKKCKENKPDYTLFEVEDFFLFGYGMDLKALYRELPHIFKSDAFSLSLR